MNTISKIKNWLAYMCHKIWLRNFLRRLDNGDFNKCLYGKDGSKRINKF
jgi:hypothetical protein